MKITQTKLLTVLLTVLLCVANSDVLFAKTVDNKIKDLIDDTAESLRKAVDALGDNIDAIQEYLRHYSWKGLVQVEASSGPATVKQLLLNGYPTAVVVKPGERISGSLVCKLDRAQCALLGVYRVVLGLKGQGAQTSISRILADEGKEPFTLIAPTSPGVYQIRFRVVESVFEEAALNAWVDSNGKEPDGNATIGIIIVK